MNFRTLNITVMIGLLTTLCASNAMADELSLELENQAVYSTDASLDVIDNDDTQSTVNLTIGYSTPRLSEHLRLLFSYQNTFQQFSEQTRLGGALKTEWHQARFLLGADIGPELWGFFRPKARIGLGYSLQELKLTTSDKPLMDYAHDFTAFGAVGAEVVLHLRDYTDPAELPYLSRVSLGLQSLYGYSYQTNADFDELRVDGESLPDDDPWRRSDVNIGTIDNSGMFWTFGFMVSVSL